MKLLLLVLVSWTVCWLATVHGFQHSFRHSFRHSNSYSNSYSFRHSNSYSNSYSNSNSYSAQSYSARQACWQLVNAVMTQLSMVPTELSSAHGLASLSRAELQQLAKGKGVRANQKNSEIIAQLLKVDAANIADSSKSGSNSRSTNTSNKRSTGTGTGLAAEPDSKLTASNSQSLTARAEKAAIDKKKPLIEKETATVATPAVVSISTPEVARLLQEQGVNLDDYLALQQSVLSRVDVFARETKKRVRDSDSSISSESSSSSASSASKGAVKEKKPSSKDVLGPKSNASNRIIKRTKPVHGAQTLKSSSPTVAAATTTVVDTLLPLSPASKVDKDVKKLIKKVAEPLGESMSSDADTVATTVKAIAPLRTAQSPEADSKINEKVKKVVEKKGEKSQFKPKKEVNLTGVTLKAMLLHLEKSVGFGRLYDETNLRCFKIDPTVASSLKVLRQPAMEWARKKVEYLYLTTVKETLHD